VSRERVGEELKGCFEGTSPNPISALKLIQELKMIN